MASRPTSVHDLCERVRAGLKGAEPWRSDAINALWEIEHRWNEESRQWRRIVETETARADAAERKLRDA